MAALIQVERETTHADTQLHVAEKSIAPWSEEQWQQVLQGYCESIQGFNPMDRQQWLNALNGFIAKNNNLKEKTIQIIIRFSFLICDWHLLIETSNKLVVLQPQDIKSLAYAYWKTGAWNKAYELLNKYMFIQPDVDSFYDWHLDLIDLSNKQAFAFYSNRNISKHLRLEPLSFHHADEYIWQYWDQSIAELCCLPEITSKQEWCDWMAYQQTLDDQTNFAVLHESFGFVGVVSLIVHRGVGFFYFWIGKDFQRKGFGTDAVRLLLEIGEKYFGITCCYAKVFEHNIASQNVMIKLGFKRLGINAAVPHDNEQLYYLGEDKPDRIQYSELHQLLCDMNSETQVDIPFI